MLYRCAYFCVLLLLGPLIGLAAPADTTLQVMTFNIRYNTPNDGEHAWPHRLERVASTIRFHAADVVGLQEALRGQIDDLAAQLPGYAWFGVGRDDGRDAGEFSPVFYRTDRLDLEDQGTFWLSETPEVPGSKSWDAAITRIATWGRFRDRTTDETLLLLNTHFDHVGQQAREQSARLITDRLAALAGDLPVVVTGDFNVEPDNPAYATMTAYLRDAQVVSETPPHGPAGTFYGFTVEMGEAERRIDYIFVGDGVQVQRYGALADQWNGLYPSDHLPVLAEIAF